MDLSSFSSQYPEARRKFLDACADRSLAVQHHLHPLPGRDGETLALDVARQGAADAPNLLVISSGCHGIEGYCGSAVQIALLRDTRWHAQCARDDLAVLYLHALNPYGFSWDRRATHENVDLNRNFRDFSQPLENDRHYLAIASLLVPDGDQPPGLGSELSLAWRALRHGRSALQAAVSGGQQVDPKGLFYAGRAPTWSHLTLRAILREHGRRCARIAWVDVHTGLGEQGVAECIYQGTPAGPESLARARRWWGPAVTSAEEGSSTSCELAGTLDMAAMEECPQAEYNGLTLEYGTLPGLKVLNALRAEQWLHNHPEASADLRHRIKRDLRAAFYIETDAWKRDVLIQARRVMDASRAGLATPLSP